MKFILAILILIVFSNCKQENYVGTYKFISSQILVTGDKEDKMQLLDSCRGSQIHYSSDTVVIDAGCILGEIIKGTTTYAEYVDSTKLANAYLNFTSRYLIKNNVAYKKLSVYFLTDNTKDSLSLLFINPQKLLLIYEPYLLEFERE